jgi:hypothetical protein
MDTQNTTYPDGSHNETLECGCAGIVTTSGAFYAREPCDGTGCVRDSIEIAAEYLKHTWINVRADHEHAARVTAQNETWRASRAEQAAKVRK